MHRPPHPGEFIREVYLEPARLTVRELASNLDIPVSTLNRILAGKGRINAEAALRFSKAIERSPDGWLAMQGNYDLWRARQTVDLREVKRVKFKSA